MYSLILHGRRSFELQKLRHLSVSMNPLQNVFSAFSSSFSSDSDADLRHPQDGRKVHDFTVSYLVDSLGLTTKLAESISKKVSFEGKGNPDSVLNLLRSHGFTVSQISTIITDYPLLLIADAEKSLGPKLKFLQSRGASRYQLTEIVSKVPEILGKRGGKTISIYYDFVKDIIEADKSSNYEKLCHHSLSQGSQQENKIRNISALRELGVPQRLLFPLLISGYGPVHGKERFEESLKKVVEMGFDPTSPKFVKALQVVNDLSDKTIEEKINVYKRLGFAVGDVWAMFKIWPFSLKFSEKKITQTFDTLKRCGLNEDEVLTVLKKNPQVIRISEQNIVNSIETFIGLGFSRDECAMMVKRFPSCFNLSADTVIKKIEFLVKKMNWPLKAVVSTPAVFGLSMEKRIVPRCNVIKALMSKGIKLPVMGSVLVCTDEAFLKRYVRKHDDKLVPELMAIFTRDYKTARTMSKRLGICFCLLLV